MKEKLKQVGICIAGLLLLPIQINGLFWLFMFLTRGSGKGAWLFRDSEGDATDMRWIVAFFGGLVLWFLILAKFKDSKLTDEEKRMPSYRQDLDDNNIA